MDVDFKTMPRPSGIPVELHIVVSLLPLGRTFQMQSPLHLAEGICIHYMDEAESNVPVHPYVQSSVGWMVRQGTKVTYPGSSPLTITYMQ